MPWFRAAAATTGVAPAPRATPAAPGAPAARGFDPVCRDRRRFLFGSVILAAWLPAAPAGAQAVDLSNDDRFLPLVIASDDLVVQLGLGAELVSLQDRARGRELLPAGQRGTVAVARPFGSVLQAYSLDRWGEHARLRGEVRG
jgi:hypothetical protein